MKTQAMRKKRRLIKTNASFNDSGSESLGKEYIRKKRKINRKIPSLQTQKMGAIPRKNIISPDEIRKSSLDTE